MTMPQEGKNQALNELERAREMKNERIVKEATPLLDLDYYENAVQRFGYKWEQDKREERLKKGGDKERLRMIRRRLTRRFPERHISPRCDKELRYIDDVDKLDMILDFCYEASPFEQVEAFIDEKCFE